jgi:hypothetical protein
MNDDDDDDDDIFFDDDDDIFFEYLKKKKIYEIEQNNLENKILVQKITSNICDIDYNYALTNQHNDKTSAMNDYINVGMEINSFLRNENGYRKDYIKKVQNLDSKFAPIPTEKKCANSYYIVHRCIRKSILINNPKGYTSTSNIQIPQFGNYCMKIYVPINTPVLVGSLDKTIRDAYEILFPRETTFLYLGNKDMDNYYLGDFLIQEKNHGGRRKSIKKNIRRRRRKSIKKNIRRRKSIKKNIRRRKNKSH